MKRFISVVVAGAFILYGMWGQDKIVLTPDAAVEFALNNNLTIKQNQISLDAKKRENSVSWNSVSPTAKVSGSYSNPLPGKENSNGTVSLGASISTNFSPSLYTSIKNAKLAWEQQQISYDTAVKNVQLAVLKSYYSILYQKENLDLVQKSLETKKKQYEANQQRYKRGVLSRVDVLEAQVNYENSVLSYENAKIQQENAIASFKQSIGIDQNMQVEFSGDFDRVLGLEKFSLENIEKKSSAVELLEKQIEQAKVSVMAQRFSAWGPSISAGYSYSYSSQDGGKNWNDGGNLSVSASIPLDGFFPWSKGAQNIENQKDNLKNLELKLADEKTTFEIETDNLEKKIMQSFANIKARKKSVQLAQTTYDMISEAYGHGTKDLLTLQVSEDNLLSAKVNLIMEAKTFIDSVYELENKCGLEFGSLLGE